MSNVTESEKKKFNWSKFQTIIGAILCVILGFILICNLTIIIKGSIHPEEPPSIFSITPLAVASPSMQGNQEGRIDKGDLIFIKDIDFDDLKVGDVVTFRLPNGDFVTHRFWRIDEEGNYRTKGDNPVNDEDREILTADTLYGIVIGRIPKLGNFAISFLATTWGMALFVGVPLIAFILYDVIRRQLYAKKKDDKTAELEAELARLRALAAETTASAPAAEALAVAEAPVEAENKAEPDGSAGE